ncbi:MAG: peroxidase family protein, partial [Flavimaricola sp.]|nr:peroxidase family protein [Flavimaricola sp.]
MVYVNTNDLKHILDQIFIAEQHAAGTPLTDLVADPQLAWGLRLVDGSLNNLTQGRDQFGAADQVMPRLLDSTFLTQPDTAHLADPNPRAPQAGPTSYLQTSGSVYDADPRIISNLIADQTLANPAAVAMMLGQLGMAGQEMLATANEVVAAHQAVLDAQAATTNVDAAITLQRAALTTAVETAQSALDAANTDVLALTTSKTTADAAVVTAQGLLDIASNALIAAQSAGDVGPALVALQAAQSTLADAQTTLNLALADLATAETVAANALSARDAKVVEIQDLEAAKVLADTALADAQTELNTRQATLDGMTVPTGLAEAQQAVNLALGNVSTAEAAVQDVNARLLTAQGELATLETDLAAAEADIATRTTTLNAAQEAAIASQAVVDAAQITNDNEAGEAAAAQTAFMAAFASYLADPVANFAAMNAAAVIWSAERAQSDAAAQALASAISLDNAADAAAATAQTALDTANDLVTSLTAQRDTAQAAVDTLLSEQGTDTTALTDARTALSDAQTALSAAQTASAAYIAAQDAVTVQQGVRDGAQVTATNAADAVTTAEGELVGLNSALTTADGEVTRLGDAATAAQGDVTTAQGVETQAQSAFDTAQAASAEIAVALGQVASATIALNTALGAAVTAASDLAAAEANVATLETTLSQANDALVALDAPGAAEAALAAAELAAAEAQTALDTLLTTHGIEMDGNNLRIVDVAPDEGLSASYNSWMTLFGQFFDHGLDLVGKGGSGTVYIPLMPDDPLYVEGSPTNFMVLTRATNQPGPDGILGTADDVRDHFNKTTPWVDQNQTYTSHASHQVFLREYELDANGRPVANGNLLHGDSGGMSTWGNVKAQAANLLGIQLNDSDVADGPLLATDVYGNFIPGANGMPQLVVANPDFATDPTQPEFLLVEGDLANPVDASQAVRNGHAFLDDIAHNAAPGTYVVDRITGETAVKQADADTETGNAIIPNQFGQNATYDNELLDRHFIAGDGRGNENFGLTAVHHIFHTEHNRQVTEMKQTIIDSGELAFINQWLREPIDATGLAGITAVDDLVWNGERLFQAAKFATEMQYQHLAFEEFGRRVQPQIAPFMVNSSLELDGAIFAEFAHVVYRFGHSMLTENVQTMDANGVNTSTDLITAFLNPVAYDQDGTITANAAAGAVARGMSREAGSNIDEFITSALRNNLVGLPLDLAALNIARGRDAGVPSLNAAREQFYAATGSEFLKPYETWADYAANLKNPASIVNFIAAYGAHDSITTATTVADKRAAAMELVLGGEGAPNDRLDFVNGTGVWATAETGINDVEFWIGGLAEAIMPFGGMLGSTFGFVFQRQMENLQNADRFYYLSRTNGMNMIGELENNSFASMIIRNTDIKDGGAHIPADIFAAMQYILEVDTSVQSIADPVSVDVDPFLAAMGTSLVERATATVDQPLVYGQLEYDNLLQFNGGDHVVLGGTNQRDILIGGLGDDALWGDAGDDLLIGGSGVNTFRAGDGDDIIKDGDDISFLHGEDGNDVISAGGGAGELIFGGRGNDVIMMGADDAKHAFAGMGDDFVLGGAGSDIVDGGEGDDWIEGGDGFDFLFGDNNNNLGGSRVEGHDVLWGGPNDNDLHGESGDDILVQGEGTHVNLAELGYDWIVHKDANSGAQVDLTRRVVPEQAEFFKDRYIDAEAVSGTQHDDMIWGDNRIGGDAPVDGLLLDNEITLFANELTQEGVDRIDGLREFLGDIMGVNTGDLFVGGNILLGGSGSDVIQGRGGDDVIDGDKMLNVRISIRDANDPTVEIGTVDSLREILTDLLDGTISPTQLKITREILDAGQEGDVDVAVYYDVRANYNVRMNADGSIMVSHINVTTGPVPLDPTNGRPNPIDGDGTDRLTNIEILRFADQEID